MFFENPTYSYPKAEWITAKLSDDESLYALMSILPMYTNFNNFLMLFCIGIWT